MSDQIGGRNILYNTRTRSEMGRRRLRPPTGILRRKLKPNEVVSSSRRQ